MADLKNRKRVNITVDIKLHERLKEISEDTGAPISRLIEKALKEKYKEA